MELQLKQSIVQDSPQDPPGKKPRLERKKRRAIIQKLRENRHFQPSDYLISTTPDFEESVIDDQIVIDKSDILIRLFESKFDGFLITCPRRWGKSFNLDLIQRFCEFEFDNNGQELPEDLKLNRLLFENGSMDALTRTRKPMKVVDSPKTMEHFGQYIVIRLDLKDLDGESFETVHIRLSAHVSDVYDKFAFLQDSPQLDTSDVEMFNTIYKNRTHDLADLQLSLKNLCYLCHRHFKRQIILLVDEYDTPTNHAFSRLDHNSITRIRDFIKSFFECAVKGREEIKLSVLTGVVRLAEDASVSPFSNLSECDIGTFSNFYGFTLPDIQLILELWSFSDKHRSLLQQWYYGYNLPQLKTPSIYNPWSVMKSLNECILNPECDPERFFRNYWVESGSIDNMKCLLFNTSILSKLTGLFDKRINRMSFKLSSCLCFDQMTRLYQLLKMPPPFESEISYDDRNTLFSFLFFSGYFTAISIDEESNECVVQFPNKEIREYFERLLKSQIRI